MRLAAYGAISTSLATAVILAAFQQRPNFYSACVYLSQSNACLMILTNMGVFLTILLGFTVQKLFFGHLRAIEEAHLRERTWFAVTETFLAMTVFRDEFNTRFVVMFVSLLFVKCFHWICQDRIDYMEQFPTIPWQFHVRMVSAMLVFLAADVAFISHAIDVTIRHGASMMIMFGFEFILLAATITAIFTKYILNVIDSRHTEAWENRSIYMFYLELATDFFKLITYLAFFSIILTYYGLPLHIIRDVYITLRSFAKKLMSFIRYRQATAHMNERYPDATVEELEATGDRTCIICREQMVQGGEAGRERTRPKKLRCGHILHFHCLRSWLERQQSCPTCRRPVLEEAPARTPIANRAPNPPPPPPMPAQAPIAIPIHMPGGNEAPAPTPGPTPALLRGASRMVAAGPITLPPGYVLPPGWAVIPAQNVQIIPQQAQNAAGAQNAPGVTSIHIGGPHGINGATGPMPNAAGTPVGNGDVTGSNPISTHDHVNPTGPTTTRQDNNATINIPTTSTAVPPNNSNTTNNMATTNATAPNQMHRQAPRNWNATTFHPAFPVTIPLFAMPGNMGVQYRAAPVPAATGRTDGASTSTSTQPTPGVNGVGPADDRDSERITLLNQMNQTMSTMQDLVSRISTLLPQSSLPTMPTTDPTVQAPQSIPPTTNTSLVSAETPTSVTLNGSASDTSPQRTPPKTPTSLHLHKRRSLSPIERMHENESSPDPIRRISTSEDEFAPEELADIRAPWVEQDIEDGLPFQEILTSKPGSPPRIRSSSQSPSRILRRRGSLLKHDITDEMLHDRGRDKNRNTDDYETATQVGGSSVDKGKGKEVFVEDVSDEE